MSLKRVHARLQCNISAIRDDAPRGWSPDFADAQSGLQLAVRRSGNGSAAETGEIARALAPAGYELLLVRGDGAELAAANDNTEAGSRLLGETMGFRDAKSFCASLRRHSRHSRCGP
jgi:hypothetical protein